MKKKFSKHTLFLTVIVLLLLIGLPSILFAVNNSTDSRSRAVASTTLRFSPPSSSLSPLKAIVGTSIPLDVYITPNSNLVSFVRLEINYNSTYFDSATTVFVVDSLSKLNLREGPTYTPGKISVSFDIGSVMENALTQDTKIGTVVLKPLNKTSRKSPVTSVSFGQSTTILSTASTDSSQENVLSSTSPAFITVSNPPKGGKPTR